MTRRLRARARTAVGLTSALTLAVVLVAPAAPAAAADPVYAGVCTMILRTSFSTPIGPVPTTGVTITVSGSGSCTANAQVGVFGTTFAVTGPNSLTPGYGCTTGIAQGAGYVDIWANGMSSPTVSIMIVNNAGTLAFTAVGVDSFNAVGVFEIDPFHQAECTTSTRSFVEWTGAFAFEQPVLLTR